MRFIEANFLNLKVCFRESNGQFNLFEFIFLLNISYFISELKNIELFRLNVGKMKRIFLLKTIQKIKKYFAF